MSKRPVWSKAKKDQVKRIFNGWLRAFSILPSEIRFDWQERDNADDDASGSVYFEVSSSFPYRSIELTCFPVASEKAEEDLQRFLLHEAIHCVLAPINKSRYEPWATYRQWGEFVTENFTHFIWSCRLYDDEKDEKIKTLEAELAKLRRRKSRGERAS